MMLEIAENIMPESVTYGTASAKPSVRLGTNKVGVLGTMPSSPSKPPSCRNHRLLL